MQDNGIKIDFTVRARADSTMGMFTLEIMPMGIDRDREGVILLMETCTWEIGKMIPSTDSEDITTTMGTGKSGRLT